MSLHIYLCFKLYLLAHLKSLNTEVLVFLNLATTCSPGNAS